MTVSIRELGKNNKLKCFCIITHNLEIPLLLYFSILVSIKFNDQNKQTHIFNSLHAGYLHILGLLLFFAIITFFKKFFQSVKQLDSRSDTTNCLAWSGFKLVASAICNQQKTKVTTGRLRLIFTLTYMSHIVQNLLKLYSYKIDTD